MLHNDKQLLVNSIRSKWLQLPNSEVAVPVICLTSTVNVNLQRMLSKYTWESLGVMREWVVQNESVDKNLVECKREELNYVKFMYLCASNRLSSCFCLASAVWTACAMYNVGLTCMHE